MYRIGILTMVLAGCIGSAFLMAQEEKGKGGMKMPDAAEMKTMMQMWEKARTPAEPHNRLAELAGDWEVTARMYMMGPTGPFAESKGSSTMVMTLGGRFLREDLKVEMSMPDMATGEMKTIKFQGEGLTGYDNLRNLYVASWADNMNTHLLRLSGAAAPSGKVITMYGEMDEPMLNVTGRMVKYVTRIESKDKHVVETYDLHAGDDYKILEVIYTRKK